MEFKLCRMQIGNVVLYLLPDWNNAFHTTLFGKLNKTVRICVVQSLQTCLSDLIAYVIAAR